MTSKEFAIELDVNDMETNIYMRVTRDDLTAISAGIQELLDNPIDPDVHDFYRQSIVDEFADEKVTLTVLTIGLHKLEAFND
ncbi:hypothetical protein [Lacticaseibacillus saniviri]